MTIAVPDNFLALSDKEQIEYIQLAEAEKVYRAYSSLADYTHWITGLAPAQHHHVMCEGLEAIERRELDILIIMLPPGSAKSTYGSVSFPSWYLGRNPRDNIIAVSNIGELAERFGRKVRNTVDSAEHKRVFPESALSPDSQAAGRWDTSEGGEYYATGVGGTVTGRRADIAIIDDPIKSREEADSQGIRDKQWNWYKDDLRTRLKPGARQVFIMTRWHEDDLLGRVLEEAKSSNQRIKIIKIPMEAGVNDPLGRQPGEMLWPEWFTPEMVEIAKRDARTWTSLYQQEPRPIGGGDFKREWFQFYVRQPQTGSRVIIVDPASGKRRDRGDYTSMWVVGRGADNNYYVVDGIRDRLNLVERTDAVIELVRKWRPSCTFYEEYGLQADIEHIRYVQEERQFRFRVKAVGGAMPKTDRIKRLISPLQTGTLWLPESLPKQCADGHVRDVIKELIDELLAFPVAVHDDASDCLARIMDPVVNEHMKAGLPPTKPVARVPSFQAFDPEMGY